MPTYMVKTTVSLTYLSHNITLKGLSVFSLYAYFNFQKFAHEYMAQISQHTNFSKCPFLKITSLASFKFHSMPHY